MLFPSLSSFTSFTSTLLLLGLILPVLSSQGDKSPAYQRCLATCTSQYPTSSPPPSFKCAYECMDTLTNLALSYNSNRILTLSTEEINNLIGWNKGGVLEGLELGQMVQFHGKWPFVKYFGMQELCSVLFSLGNLLVHWFGFKSLLSVTTTSTSSSTSSKRIRRNLTSTTTSNDNNSSTRLKYLYSFNALISIHAWFWSSIFHTRDLPLTEKADYFSATSVMLYGLILVIIRINKLYKPLQSKKLKTLLGIGTIILLLHCYYLSSLPRFNYTYNMTFNIILGLSSILLWFYFTYTSPQLPHRLSCLTPLILLFSLSFLEINDFPPIPSGMRLIDAHALWHAGTIFVVRGWYKFLKRDLEWVCLEEEGGGEGERD